MLSHLQNFHILSSGQNSEVDVKGYNDAFKKSVSCSAQMNLFAVEVVNMIEKVIKEYKARSLLRIPNGAVNAAWSQEKLNHATALLFHIEQVNLSSSHGLEVKNDFLTQVDKWGKEFLPAMRIEFFKEQKTIRTPDGGNLEKIFYPLIKDTIEIIFQVYTLYQLQDRTRQDFRVHGEGSDEAFALLWNAQDCAKQAVIALLGDYSSSTLNKSKNILERIKSEHEELYLVTAASNLRTGGDSAVRQGINAERLLHVHRLFTKYLYGSEMKDLKSALESYMLVAKNGLLSTLSNASYYLGVAAATGSSLFNYLLGTVVQPEQIKDDDDSSQAVRGGFDSFNFQDDYEPSSSSVAPVLTAAPLVSRQRVDDLIDLDDVPVRRSPSPAHE